MDSTDVSLLEEAMGIIKELNKSLDRFELTQLLSGPYDKEGAVIYITAGAGGTDAQVITVYAISIFYTSLETCFMSLFKAYRMTSYQ